MRVIAPCLCASMLTLLLSCSKENEQTTAPETPEPGVREITYRGWDNAVEITSEEARVVVVPAIGRIMFYGPIDGDNVLWENPAFFGKTLPPGQPYTENGSVIWANFGGDKVWPTEQSDFPAINDRSWPPDHWFDGSTHDAELLNMGVRLTGPVSDYCGARSVREITLAKDGTVLTISQRIEKAKSARKRSVEPISYTIWNVTQIRSPEAALIKLNANSRFQQRHYLFSSAAGARFTVQGDAGIFVPDPAASLKMGADSDGWVGAVIGDVAIGEFFQFQADAAYPDNGLSAEIYTSPEYTELELLSPLKRLALGEKMDYTITWDLYRLPSSANSTSKRIDAAVNWLNNHQ